MDPNTQEVTITENEVEISTTLSGRVILFNDEEHSFDEVINQIIKAINCDTETATSITYQAHSTGSSIVYSGDFQSCLRVSAILEEIDLLTQIEC